MHNALFCYVVGFFPVSPFDRYFRTLPIFAISLRRLLFNVARVKASSKKKKREKQKKGGEREREMMKKPHVFMEYF